MEEQWKENMLIFLHNLSPFYALSVGISIFAMLFSIWYSGKCKKELLSKAPSQAVETTNSKEVDGLDISHDEMEGEISLPTDASSPMEALQSRIKVARHQAIVNHLSSKMTPAQLMEEKETEKAQLAAILNLLKEQQEKFNVSDMGELQEQLSLYR